MTKADFARIRMEVECMLHRRRLFLKRKGGTLRDGEWCLPHKRTLDPLALDWPPGHWPWTL